MTAAVWSVAVFTSREDAVTLTRTVQAVLAACVAHATTIDVLVDGNAETAAALERTTIDPGRATLRLWLVPWRDKACTWNRYVHEIAPRADCAFFIDGYVRPRPDSLVLLADALADAPDAWAASGVPTVGASAGLLRTTMQTDGGLHGNLYALRATVVEGFRARGFRLPLGLYRNDSLIGAVAAFGGDPALETWDARRRIAVPPGATWDNDVAPFGIDRVRGALKRRLRQAQGELENAAFREHLAVRRQRPEALPRTVQALLAAVPPTALPRGGPLQRLLLREAARRVARGRDWSGCDEPARLLRTWPDPSPVVAC